MEPVMPKMEMNLLETFKLQRQGAEARVYIGEFFGQPAILKERFSKKYRLSDLDSKLNKERIKGEARSLIRCKTIGVRTPTIFHSDLNRGWLVLEYLQNAQTAKEFIQSLWKDKSENNKIIEELSIAIGKTIGILHKNNIIHGDLTTSNILVESTLPIKLCLIDFGLGFTDVSSESKGVDLYVLERALVSTHPNSEFMLESIIKAYTKEISGQKDCKDVIMKYEEVRLRGRKRSMVG